MLTTHHNISAKALKAAKETLADAIEGTAVLAGVFETLKQISDEGVFPFDPQIMGECDSMMTAMNRLLYEQESKLKHFQTMQKVRRQVKQTIAQAKTRSARQAGNNVSAAV